MTLDEWVAWIEARLIPVTIALVVGLKGAAAFAGSLLGVSDLPIPLAAGTTWEYREAYTERLGEIDSTEDQTTHFTVVGAPDRPFLRQRGGADPASGPAEWGESWLVVTPWTGEQALPLPLEVGRTGPSLSEGMPGWTVEAEEEVVVPAGAFRALRCALRTRRSESVLWIAPGVGVVRETHGPPGRRPEIERVLLSWRVGGARPQRLRGARHTCVRRALAGPATAGSRPVV